MGVPEEGLTAAVIDLDRPAPPPAAGGGSPVRHRHLGFVLAALLAVTLGGSVPATPAAWRHAGSLEFRSDADGFVAVAGSRVYTVTVDGDQRVTTAWDTDPVRRAWRVETPGDVVGGGRLTPIGRGLLLLQTGSEAAVLDAATGAVRWRAPIRLRLIGRRTGLAVDPTFAPGTEYDRPGLSAAPLYFTADGQPHTAPPEYTDLYGIDLATGRRLWSARERGHVLAAPVPDDSGALLVVTADAVDVRDGTTGASLRRRTVPPAPPGETRFAEVAGDLVLLRTPDGATAYALETLEARWSAGDPVNVAAGACDGVFCLRARRTLAVLDPRTGGPAWRTEAPNVNLGSLGALGEVVETQTLTGRPVRVRDARTGAVRTELTGWDTAVVVEPAGGLLLSRYDPELPGTVFGFRRAGAPTVHRLGVSGTVLRDCRASAKLLACRSADDVEVFAYRAGA